MEKNKSSFSENEEKILKFWQDQGIFNKSLEIRENAEKFSFYDGPPFATGLPHYGHILSSVIKDLIPRYKTMRGFYVRRRWGWDCHGLPIETLVEKKLNISGKKQIEEIGIDKFNETARGMVLDYINQWKAMVDRVGRWVEFDDSYKTMDTTFMESVWWALKQIWDKGKIYEGKKVLLYCPRCETPVSKAETEMDGGYKDVSGQSITVKFKLINPEEKGLPKNTSILTWTTTPWTLPGNVALAISPDMEYVLVSDGEESYILGKPLLERYKDKNWKIVESVKSSDLVGLKYEPLYSVAKILENENSHKITTGDFITSEDGTGVVHIAVMYGEDDYKIGQREKLPFIQLLTSNGIYNEDAPELLRGKHYNKAQTDITQDLNNRKIIVHEEVHNHSYPFCWRCGSALIYNALSAWFIDIQSVKDKLIKLNEKINWYPGFIKEGRFLYILESAPDWNISRNRYWATALPFWKCEKCKKSECFGSVTELRDKSNNFAEIYGDKKLEEIDLHRPYIDEVIVSCECGGEMHRVSEVIDCWVESSSMPFAELHYPFENEQMFKQRMPAKFIGEYIGQTRAWFYYLHVLSTILYDDISFENAVVTGTILSEDGTKMSKSKGNFPDPMVMIDTYGADSLRFYLMSSVVMQADNLFFSERDLRESYNKVINIIYNVKNYYEMYSSSSDADFELSNVLDKWIVSEMNLLIKSSTKHLDNYDTVRYCRGIREYADILSTWWLRRSRDRFKGTGEERKNVEAVLKHILRNLALIIAPLMPYASESIWQIVKLESDRESVHLADWPEFDENLIDKKLDKEMKFLREIVEVGHSLRAQNGLKVRQPLGRVSVESTDLLSSELVEILLDELNVKKYSDKLDGEGVVSASGKDFKVYLDTNLTDELLDEGIYRELARYIQDLRKVSGYLPHEMAKVGYKTSSEKLSRVFEAKKNDFKESMSIDLSSGNLEKSDNMKVVKVNGEEVELSIRK